MEGSRAAYSTAAGADTGSRMAASSKGSNHSIVIAESSTSNSKSTTPADLLSVLRCPKVSELARKRVIDCNPLKWKKSIDPRQHVREFPSESLTTILSTWLQRQCASLSMLLRLHSCFPLTNFKRLNQVAKSLSAFPFLQPPALIAMKN